MMSALGYYGVAPVPLPATGLLMLGALGGLGALKRKRGARKDAAV